MRVINSGDRYEIRTNALNTYDSLPTQVYKICFDQMSGFYLEKHLGIEVKEPKVYGVHNDKVKKVLESFTLFKKNLGVILSGDKGIGKSLFSRMLALQALEKDIPVIVCEGYVPGIASYIEKIDQKVMILFDEFDKTFFNNHDSVGAQASMLSLFDGVSPGKKLFVITCNELTGLNDFLINRPGRFHYHFRFEYPGRKEVEEYLMDKLPSEYYDEIPKVVSFSMKVNLNFDCLSAIAFELAKGLTFEDAILDLNIINLNKAYYDLKLYFKNGMCMKLKALRIDIFDDEELNYCIGSGKYWYRITFNPTDSVFDLQKGGDIITADKFKLKIDEDSYYDDDEEDKKHMDEAASMEPDYIVLTRQFSKKLHYTL